MVKCFGLIGKNNSFQNGHIGKKIFCDHNGKRVLESRHIDQTELWNQARVDIKAKIKAKENYLCIVHYIVHGMHIIAQKIQSRTVHLQFLKC